MLMTKYSAIFLLSLLFMGCASVENSYKAVTCDTSLQYDGTPLYQGAIEFPTNDFIFGDTFDESMNLVFDKAMAQAMARTKANVMSAAVATKNGVWKATRSSNGSSEEALLYWASVGKALTATVIMQLVEEGKLSLDQSASQWVTSLPNASSITIDHLLQHTSGLFSANEDLVARKNPRYHSPEENIKISTRHGAMFCPGQHWRYSNTGYTVLGKIIEQVDGRPYHEAVNARISARLELDTLRALAPLEQAGDVSPLIPADGTQPLMFPSWGYAAGSVVSSAEDMVRFWHALLTAKLLNDKNTENLFEHLYPMFDENSFYGRGVMLYSLPSNTLGAKTWLGHSGGTQGGKAVVAYSPNDKAFVAVALTGDGSAEASAHLLLKQLGSQD